MSQNKLRYTDFNKQDSHPFLAIDSIIIILFILFLTPFYFNGMSVNYSFILIPVFFALKNGRLIRPDSLISLFFISAILIFLFSMISMHELNFLWRRLLSFIIILSLASFVLIRINQRIITDFAYALVVLSAVLTLPKLSSLIASNHDSVLMLKGELGNQRTVLIHLMAFFWLLYELLFKKRSTFIKLFILLFTILSFLGVLLSFSRGAYVAVSLTLVLIFYRYLKFIYLFKVKDLIYLLILFCLIFFLKDYLNLFFNFFKYTFIDPLLSGEILNNYLTPGLSSEGIRSQIWSNILNYVFSSPVFGSGFLGYWITTEDLSGSSHSDFLDRFLRFGIPLFILYIYILIKILLYLRYRFTSFYYGYISLLIFGIFNEAFAISSGGVVLSFLMSLYSQRKFLEEKVV